MHLTHNCFTALFPGLPGWAGDRRSLLLDFMVQGKITELVGWSLTSLFSSNMAISETRKITEADTPTIWPD